jgi:O-antigen/teichoic acid export membrane protein
VHSLNSTRSAVGVARGASYLIVNNAAVVLIGLIAFALIARLISREEMGAVVVLTLIATGAQLLSSLGFGATATRFVSSLEATGEHDKMRSAGYECILITIAATLAASAIVYLSAGPLAASLLGSSSQANLIRLLPLEICALGISSILTNVLIGVKKFKETAISGIASFALRQGLVVALLMLGWGLSGIVIGWGIGDSLDSIVLAIYTRKYLGPVRIGYGMWKLIKFSTPLFVGSAAGYAWTWFDRALLLPLVPLAQLGSYNVAVRAYGVLSSTPSAISGALFPYYSHFHPTGSEASPNVNLENAMKVASRYIAYLTVPLSVGLAVTALPAATLLAGRIYADAALPLAIMSLSMGLICQSYALSQIFVVLGKTTTSASITIASVALPTFVGFVIIPYLGISGGAVARGLSLMFSLILSILVLRRFLKVSFDMRAYAKAWIASLVMAAIVLIAQQLYYSKYLLPVYIAIGGVVFVIVLRMLHAATPSDLELISDYLGPRMNFITRLLRKLLGVRAEAT